MFSSSIGCRVAVVASVLALACALLPTGASVAYADYNKAAPSKDYASSANKVEVKGSPIKASAIPQGTYHITANSSTTMGSITDVTLTVRDGAMSVNFTLTPSYTAVYPGKPEEAAALAGDDGKEPSPSYIMGKLNADGETRNFTMSISSLNAVLVYSAYNGNSKRNSGMWYGRNVCFNSSAEIDALVATSGKDDSPGDDDKPGEDTPDTDDSGTDKPSAGQGGGGTSGKGDAGGKRPTAGKGTGDGTGSATGTAGSSSGKSRKDNASSAPTTSEQSDAAEEDSASNVKDATSAKRFSALGGPFTPIAYASENSAAGDAATKEADVLDEQTVDYQKLLGAGVVTLAVAGFIIRLIVFRRQHAR